MKMHIIKAGALALLLSLEMGCSTMTPPNPLRAIRPIADLKALGTLTDGSIVLYAAEALDSFEGSDTANTIIALSGAATMAGLGTAAVVSPGSATGLLLGVNGILMALNIWQPVERARADNQGAGLIREALGNYVLAFSADGYCTIPNNRVTPAGAQLFATTNSIIKVVNDLRQGILDLGSQSVKQLQAARSQDSIAAARSARAPTECK
jgi:hypothetical protein